MNKCFVEKNLQNLAKSALILGIAISSSPQIRAPKEVSAEMIPSAILCNQPGNFLVTKDQSSSSDIENFQKLVTSEFNLEDSLATKIRGLNDIQLYDPNYLLNYKLNRRVCPPPDRINPLPVDHAYLKHNFKFLNKNTASNNPPSIEIDIYESFNGSVLYIKYAAVLNLILSRQEHETMVSNIFLHPPSVERFDYETTEKDPITNTTRTYRAPWSNQARFELEVSYPGN